MKTKKINIPNELKNFVLKDIDVHFTKEKEIGNGAQGLVWLATDNLGDKYAIKQLNIDPSKPNRQIKRYISECAALMRAHHPFVIEFIGMTDRAPFIVITEYVSQVNLSKFLTHQHFTVQNHNGSHLTRIAMAIANGMMHLHKIGIIHRDLKPGNVLIGNDFLPRICDFGLVREFDKKSHPTAALGTPNWMAPEVIRGGNYTEKCDIFSYSMILFEMATKERPLAEYGAQEVLKFYADENYRPDFPDDIKIPSPLKKLIQKCWSEDPNDRPSFEKIFDEFADLKVKFEGSSDAKIAGFAKELRGNDVKRRILPSFKLFPTTVNDYSDNEDDANEDNAAKRSKQSSKKKNNNNIINEKSTAMSNRRPVMDSSDSIDPYIPSESDDHHECISSDHRKVAKSKKKKFVKQDTDKGSSFEDAKSKGNSILSKNNNDNENVYELETFHPAITNEHNSPVVGSKISKSKSKSRITLKDNKNSDIYTVKSFTSENDASNDNSDDTSQKKRKKKSLIENKKEGRDKKKATAPVLAIVSTKIKTKKTAPILEMPDKSLDSYCSDSDDSEVDRIRRKDNASKYAPLQSPAYSARTAINFNILNDIDHPLFKSELDKVSKQSFTKFLSILKNHLCSQTPTDKIILLLKKTDSLIADKNCLAELCDSKICQFLPCDNMQTADYTIDILTKVCKSQPQCIQTSFEAPIISLINLKDKKVAELLYVYSQSFDKIEDPWPLLDMLITQKKKFAKSEAGAIVVNTLLYLVQNFKNYKKNRMNNVRLALVFFMNTSVPETVIAAYKAVEILYDNEFELPFQKITNDLIDENYTDYVVALFVKMDQIPSVKEIIFPLLRIARVNGNAITALIKMVKAQYETAVILFESTKWLKYRLPTFNETFKLLLAVVRYPDLKKAAVDVLRIADLFNLSVLDKNGRVYMYYNRMLTRVKFDQQFLIKLQDNDFFINFFKGIMEINDEDVTLSSLKALEKLGRIGYCDEYRLFYKALQRFADRKDEIANEAKACMTAMMPPRKWRKRSSS